MSCGGIAREIVEELCVCGAEGIEGTSWRLRTRIRLVHRVDEDGPRRQSAQSADHLAQNGCFLAVFIEVVCTLSAAVHAGCGRCPLNYCVGVLPSIP